MQDGAWVHGCKLDPFTDFYPRQKRALKALWEAIHRGVGIPLEVPTKDGKLVTGVCSKSAKAEFKGFVNHYNLTKRKIDCAGLDILDMINDVKEKTED